MTTTRRLNCIPLNDLHVPAALMDAPAIAITTNTNYYDLKIGSQTPYYTRRCTSYHYYYYYYYYTYGIIVPVKNTRTLFVFSDLLWSHGPEYNINISMIEFITYLYTKTCNVCYTTLFLNSCTTYKLESYAFMSTLC